MASILSLDHLEDALVQRVFACRGQELEPAEAPVTYLVAANGIWKRGSNAVVDACVCLDPTPPPIPGLATLDAYVRLADWSLPLPGSLLARALLHAWCARQIVNGDLVHVEQQLHVCASAGELQLVRPPQETSPATVTYTMPATPVIVDIHSHGVLPAFFSSTDDHDDDSLGISVVLGTLHRQPTIACRVNVYGHHAPIPAAAVFDSLGVATDTYARAVLPYAPRVR